MEAEVSCCSPEPLVAVVFGKWRCSSVEGVEWGIPVGPDVLASLHPHLKTIARTRGSGLDKRYRMYGAGRGR